ncbi:hypothetical protein H9P43_000900 [Blastocladiella emersonii ATCC 22665]|nr:hypothetical protein H9P43_000900 [Blastocladiella emersonii ATCC 22665]
MSTPIKSPATPVAVAGTTARAAFADLARVPVVARARFLTSNVVQVATTVRDAASNKKRTLQQTLVLRPGAAAGDGPLVLGRGPVTEDEGAGLDAVFYAKDSGARGDSYLRAVQRTITVGDAKKRVVEVWDQDGVLVTSTNVTDVHGDFYTDDQIGGLAWSAEGDRLVYVAESKPPKSDSPNDFVHNPDFGELYWGKRPPVLVVLEPTADHDTAKLGLSFTARVIDLGFDLSPSKPFFVLDDTAIAFVGYERAPKVWGIAHCPNRAARLYTVPSARPAADDASSTAATATPHTPDSISVRHPVPHTSRTRVAFLSVPIGGPHATCSALHELDLVSGLLTERAAPVASAATTAGFPGLFVDTFTPMGGAYSDTLVASTAWRSERAVIVIDVASGTVTRVTPSAYAADSDVSRADARGYAAASVDPANPARILVVASAINAAPEIELWDTATGRVGALRAPGIGGAAGAAIAGATVETYTHSATLESIVVRPREVPAATAGSPLVIIPHGGPHTVYANEWSDAISPTALTLVGAGYTVAYVNYTGSTGFGTASIDALVGKIGDLEVKECHQVAVEHLARKSLQLDAGNVFYAGGSHSGLIGTFIVAQYPGFYRAAVIRNPAISIGTFSGTDILDWSFAECGLPHDLRRPSFVTPAVYARMWQHSGTSVIESVTTPTLVMLGAKDARVPPFQGLEWAAWLRGNKPEVPVRTLWFPDAGHGLDSMDAHRFGFEAILHFFEEFRVVVARD